MPTVSQVIGISMNDKRSPYDTVRPSKRHHLITDLHTGSPATVGFNIPQITDVSHGRIRTTMLLVERIVVCTCTGTSIRIVAKFVNMKSMFTFCQPVNFSRNLNRFIRTLGMKTSLSIETYTKFGFIRVANSSCKKLTAVTKCCNNAFI